MLVLVLLSNLAFWLNVEQQLFALYFIQVRVRKKVVWRGRIVHVWAADDAVFLLTPGCHSFPPRLPEQHGVCLETAQLHGRHPRGKHTLAGLRPPGFLRRVADKLMRHERHCLAAAAYCRSDWLLVCHKLCTHFRLTRLWLVREAIDENTNSILAALLSQAAP